MKRSQAPTFSEDLPAPVLSQLAAATGPAWLVDIAGGRILAASAAGLKLLGLETSTSAPLLDAAMPAIARLRAMASDDSHNATETKPLVFWAQGRAVRRHCHIQMLQGSSPMLAFVVAFEERPDEPHQSSRSIIAGDDAAKLKEIARRIRDGQAGARHERRLRESKGWAGGAASHMPEARPSVTPEPDVAVPISLRASLAHELKTPASAVAVAAEIMKDERFGPLGSSQYTGYAADIHENAKHMLRLIDSMLAEGADPDGVERPLNFAELDAVDLLKSAVSQLAPLAERAGITLTLEVAPRLPHLVADATSLRQILFNLVTNSLKFTGRGGAVAVSASHSGDGPLTISVSDTGLGMTKTEAERLLAPAHIQRSSGRAKAGGVGLGLGLPLVQALAAKNGAALSIDSAPGKGTIASVVFAKDRVIPI